MSQFSTRLGASLIFAAICYAAQSKAADMLTVVDESNRPVAGATIMLGYEPGNPFQGNVLNTDNQGTAQIPADWKAALPITIQAAGYITRTVPMALPGVQNLNITHQEPANAMEVKGTTAGYGQLVTDGKVDFGLVIPAIARDQMLSFDVSSIISPSSDTIDILGNEVKIPSNLALPDQTENYIFPIELNKPDYRIYPRQPGTYNVAITHGQFPLQRVVNDIRNGKSFFDIVNYFDFKELGQRKVDVSGNVSGIDLAVNQTPFNNKFNVKAPNFANNLVMMSLGLIESEGRFLPTDVKRFTPNSSLDMRTNSGAGTPSALSLLLENTNATMAGVTEILKTWFAPLAEMPLAPEGNAPNFNRLSFTLTSAAGGVAPSFLPLINKPMLNGQTLKFDMPQLPAGLMPVAMYINLSEIETLGQDKMTIERRTRMWEIMSDAWVDHFELPKITVNRRKDRKYRWEVIFMARPAGFVDPNPGMSVDLNTITHATRNTLDI